MRGVCHYRLKCGIDAVVSPIPTLLLTTSFCAAGLGDSDASRTSANRDGSWSSSGESSFSESTGSYSENETGTAFGAAPQAIAKGSPEEAAVTVKREAQETKTDKKQTKTKS